MFPRSAGTNPKLRALSEGEDRTVSAENSFDAEASGWPSPEGGQWRGWVVFGAVPARPVRRGGARPRHEQQRRAVGDEPTAERNLADEGNERHGSQASERRTPLPRRPSQQRNQQPPQVAVASRCAVTACGQSFRITVQAPNAPWARRRSSRATPARTRRLPGCHQCRQTTSLGPRACLPQWSMPDMKGQRPLFFREASDEPRPPSSPQGDRYD